MMKKISISGMGCMMCVKRVVKILEQLGASDIQCEIGQAIANFPCDDEAIKTAIEKGGYTVVAIEKV